MVVAYDIIALRGDAQEFAGVVGDLLIVEVAEFDSFT